MTPYRSVLFLTLVLYAIRTTASCNCCLPLSDSVYTWIRGDSYVTYNSGTVWEDVSGNGHHSTSVTGNPTYFQHTFSNGKRHHVMHGVKGDSIDFDGAIGDSMTFFGVSRYPGLSGGRIFTSRHPSSWFSGHYGSSAGVAGNGFNVWTNGPVFLTNLEDKFGVSWVLSVSQLTNYRANGVNITLPNIEGTPEDPDHFTVNNYFNQSQRSDWEVLEIIVYDRLLSTEEIEMVESYLNTNYGITANIPVDEALYGSCYPPISSTATVAPTFSPSPPATRESTCLPLRDNVHTWLTGESYDPTNRVWLDLSGNGHGATSIDGAPTVVERTFDNGKVYKTVSGLQKDTVTFDGAIGGSMTFFGMSRYNGTHRGRIFTSQAFVGANWFSGHISGFSGVAGTGQVSLTELTDRFGDSWVLSVSQHSNYRANGLNLTLPILEGIPAELSHFTINKYRPTIVIPYTTIVYPQRSEWEVAEVLVYDRVLNTEEIEMVESYFNTHYGITNNIPVDEVSYGSCYPPISVTTVAPTASPTTQPTTAPTAPFTIDDCVPLSDSVFTWLRGDSYDNVTKVWHDVSGNGHSSTATGGNPIKEEKEFPNDKTYYTVSGQLEDSFDFDGAIGDYMTFFGVSRYTSTNDTFRQRIFTSRSPTNWYSGHLNSLTAVAGNGYNPLTGGPVLLTPHDFDFWQEAWLISVSQRRIYRGNGLSGTLSRFEGFIDDPDHFTINNYLEGSQRSHWEVAEVIVYDRLLSTQEIIMVESYLSTHYVVWPSLFYNSALYASCYPPITLLSCLPHRDSVYTRLTGDSYDTDRKVWVDNSGNGHHSTATGGNPEAVRKAFSNGKIYKIVSGNLEDSFDFDGAIGDSMTFFGLTRYTSDIRQRIITTRSPTNWYSGHVSGFAGVGGNGYNQATGGPVWLTDKMDRYGDGWVLSVSQIRNYIANGVDLTIPNLEGVPADPDHFTINNYMPGSQRSDWEVAEIIVYNRLLNTEEIRMVESYFNTHYGITTDIPVDETEYGRCYPPLEIGCLPLTYNVYTWLRGDSYDPDNRVWIDKSGCGHSSTQVGGNPRILQNTYENGKVYKSVAGGQGDSLDFNGAIGEAMTFFGMSRYTGPSRARIFTTKAPTNWFSGHLATFAGVAGNGYNELTSGSVLLTDLEDTFGDSWVLSVSQRTSYRANGLNLTRSTLEGVTDFPDHFTINNYMAGSQRSDWEVAEVLVYDRVLNTDEIEMVENYFNTHYGITNNIPVDEATYGSCYPPVPVTPPPTTQPSAFTLPPRTDPPTNQPVTTVSPTPKFTTCLPLNDSVYTWLTGDSYNDISNVWLDMSGNGHTSTSIRGTPRILSRIFENGKEYNIVGGQLVDSFDFDGAIGASMTFFGLSRYTSNINRGRIFTARDPNMWFSGHEEHTAGVAGSGMLNKVFITEKVDRFGLEWVLSVSQRTSYRGNGLNLTRSVIQGNPTDTDHFTINNFSDTTAYRAYWEVAEVIVYDRILSTEEIEMVESYFNTHYGITSNIPVDEDTYGSCYPPLSVTPVQSPTTEPPVTEPPTTEAPTTQPPASIPFLPRLDCITDNQDGTFTAHLGWTSTEPSTPDPNLMTPPGLNSVPTSFGPTPAFYPADGTFEFLFTSPSLWVAGDGVVVIDPTDPSVECPQQLAVIRFFIDLLSPIQSDLLDTLLNILLQLLGLPLGSGSASQNNFVPDIISKRQVGTVIDITINSNGGSTLSVAEIVRNFLSDPDAVAAFINALADMNIEVMSGPTTAPLQVVPIVVEPPIYADGRTPCVRRLSM